MAKPIEDCARRVQGAAPVAGREPLSAREREVFKLIAEGTLSIVEMVFRA